jgi:transcription elongation factor Elf1
MASKQIYCPYCGESIEIIIDTSVQEQQYIEDCSVCCRPIEMEVVVDSVNVLVYPKRDDE